MIVHTNIGALNMKIMVIIMGETLDSRGRSLFIQMCIGS
jgi:hypothetical protein